MRTGFNLHTLRAPSQPFGASTAFGRWRRKVTRAFSRVASPISSDDDWSLSPSHLRLGPAAGATAPNLTPRCGLVSCAVAPPVEFVLVA